MRPLLLVVAVTTIPVPLFAQKHPPVWDSYLSRTDVFQPDRLSVAVDLVWKKNGGPTKNNRKHKIYLLAFLHENESKILELAKDKDLTQKASKKDKLLLEVLQEKKLVVVLRETTSRRSKSTRKSGTVVERIKWERRSNTFPFSFQFQNQDFFDAISKLPGYDLSVQPNSGGYTWYMDKVKLLAFIPTNDSKYAPRVNKDQYDFAFQYDHETLIQYFRPLPHRFIFKKLPNKEMLVYIN